MNIYPNKPYSENKGLTLPTEEQKEILDKCQRLYNKMMHAAIHINDDDIQHETYLAYHNYLYDLKIQGIYVEYGWSGHLNEHFIASEEDAWKQEEWLDQLREDCYE